MQSYRPRRIVRRERHASATSSRRWRRPATAAWAPIRTPMAANCCKPLSMPDFRDYAVRCLRPGSVEAEATRVLGTFLRDVMKLNLEQAEFPSVRPGRDRLEPSRRRVSRSPTRRGWRTSRASTSHLSPDGRVMEVLSEHLLPGLARRLSAHRPPRPLLVLRGLRPHRRLDVQSACEMAEGVRDDPVAQPDRLAELSADVACLAAGSQRLLATRIRASSITSLNKKADVVRIYLPPDANTPALGGRPLPAQPQLRQRDRRRQAAGVAVARYGRRRSRIARPAPASGNGPATTTAIRTW